MKVIGELLGFFRSATLRVQALQTNHELQSEIILLEEKYVRIKNRIFLPSTEKRSKPSDKTGGGKPRPKNKTLKPSERYPNVPVVEQDIELD